MPIKHITDNIEKEIEQIRTRNGAYVDYIFTKTLSGYKRIFVGRRKKIGIASLIFRNISNNSDPMDNYRVYGNTVNGESVGDKTKNLLNNNASTQTINEVTFTVNPDGSVTCNGTATGGVARIRFIPTGMQLEPGAYIFTGCPQGGGVSTYELNLFSSDSTTISVRDRGDGGNFEITAEASELSLYPSITIRSGYTCENLTFYPMIRKSEIEDGAYEPFGYKVPVTVSGKNLLDLTITSGTINGIEVTVNEDRSITLNGEGVSYARFIEINSSIDVSAGMILSGCPDTGVSGLNMRLTNTDNSAYIADSGSGVTVSSDVAGNANIKIRIPANYSCDNLTFYPMIRKADISDSTYEPYHAPVSADIYLSEPLGKSGDDADYIDYANQKRYNADGTDEDVSVPGISTISGTNVLTIGTQVQPSEIYIKGKIK